MTYERLEEGGHRYDHIKTFVSLTSKILSVRSQLKNKLINEKKNLDNRRKWLSLSNNEHNETMTSLRLYGSPINNFIKISTPMSPEKQPQSTVGNIYYGFNTPLLSQNIVCFTVNINEK